MWSQETQLCVSPAQPLPTHLKPETYFCLSHCGCEDFFTTSSEYKIWNNRQPIQRKTQTAAVHKVSTQKKRYAYSLCKSKEILSLTNLGTLSAGKKRVYSIAIYQNHAWACPWSSQRLLLVNGSAGNQWGWMRTTSTGPLFASSLSELNMLVGSFSSFWNQGLIQPRNSFFFFLLALSIFSDSPPGIWTCRDPGIIWSFWPLLPFCREKEGLPACAVPAFERLGSVPWWQFLIFLNSYFAL